MGHYGRDVRRFQEQEHSSFGGFDASGQRGGNEELWAKMRIDTPILHLDFIIAVQYSPSGDFSQITQNTNDHYRQSTSVDG